MNISPEALYIEFLLAVQKYLASMYLDITFLKLVAGPCPFRKMPRGPAIAIGNMMQDDLFSGIEESLANVRLSPPTSRVHTKRPRSHEGPLEELPDGITQSLVADEIQRRVVETINHNMNDMVNTLWTRIEHDRSAKRSPITSGYEKLPQKSV